jgi:hypothetical protein
MKVLIGDDDRVHVRMVSNYLINGDSSPMSLLTIRSVTGTLELWTMRASTKTFTAVGE